LRPFFFSSCVAGVFENLQPLIDPCIKPKSQVLEINLKQRFVIIERYKEAKDSISDRAMNSLSSGERSLKKVILSRRRRST
jgi:hypothetical protein